MTYHEKRTIATSVTGLLVMITYLIYAIIKYNEGSIESLTLKFWAARMLIFMGIGMVTVIVVMILFHIVYSIALAIKLKIDNKDISDKEIELKINQIIKTDTVQDEMAKLIELKAMRFGFIFAGIGFVLSLVALLLDFSPIIMINILYLSFGLGSALEGLVQFYYYKKGIHHV